MEKAAKQPGLGRWSVGISLALLFIGLCFCFALLLQSWATNQVISRVTSTLLAPQEPDSSEALWNAAFADLRLIGIRPEIEDTLRNLMQVNQALLDDNFERAAKAYQVILKYSRFSLIELLGANQRAARKLGTFKKYLEFGATLQNNRANFEAKLTELNSQSKASLDRYLLVQQDFYDFVSLAPSEGALSAKNCTDLHFYASGILLGLPVIPQFPDNISDGAEFKLRLDNSGGEIKISGDDAPIQFQNKITEIARAANSVKADCETIITQSMKTQNALTETQNRIDRAIINAKRVNQSLLMSSITSAQNGMDSIILENIDLIINKIKTLLVS